MVAVFWYNVCCIEVTKKWITHGLDMNKMELIISIEFTCFYSLDRQGAAFKYAQLHVAHEVIKLS